MSKAISVENLLHFGQNLINFIKSKLSTVATSGNYNDLTNKPTIPSAPGTLNTNTTAAQSVSGSESLAGTIVLHKISKTGSYTDLLNKPAIPDVSGKEDVANKTTSISSSNTDTQYPSAKAVNTAIENVKSYTDSAISSINSEVWTFTLTDDSTVTKQVLLT